MDLCAKECSNAVSMAIELYENEEIGPEQTGDLELRWGNVEAVAQPIKDIAHRRGFGAVLAECQEGSRTARRRSTRRCRLYGDR